MCVRFIAVRSSPLCVHPYSSALLPLLVAVKLDGTTRFLAPASGYVCVCFADDIMSLGLFGCVLKSPLFYAASIAHYPIYL